ncbi:MAG: hypothetical protein JNL96_21185 [Planctomycetaceae bacterium]|nr:hypothetical protein [Planctomycetaceae bacterium]
MAESTPNGEQQQQSGENGVLERLGIFAAKSFGEKIKTVNDALLVLTLCGLFGITYYGLMYALPGTVGQINAGHKEARDDFKATLKEDRAANAEMQRQWIDALRHNRDGFGMLTPLPESKANGS